VSLENNPLEPTFKNAPRTHSRVKPAVYSRKKTREEKVHPSDGKKRFTEAPGYRLCAERGGGEENRDLFEWGP